MSGKKQQQGARSAKRARYESDDDRSSDGSDDGRDLEGFIVDEPEEGEIVSEESKSIKSADDEELMKKEAEQLTKTINSTVVGGRTLRNRETIKKPTHYFDEENYAKLMAQDDKKEKIAMLKRWAASGEYVCPILSSLTKKTALDVVEEEYRKAKQALEIPDTDDEDEEEEEQEDTEDSDAEMEDEESEEEEVTEDEEDELASDGEDEEEELASDGDEEED